MSSDLVEKRPKSLDNGHSLAKNSKSLQSSSFPYVLNGSTAMKFRLQLVVSLSIYVHSLFSEPPKLLRADFFSIPGRRRYRPERQRNAREQNIHLRNMGTE